MQVTAESDKKTFVYQGHIHSKDFGTFQLTRQGIFTLYSKQVDHACIVNGEYNPLSIQLHTDQVIQTVASFP